jgi:ATP synthase subunit 6
LPYPSQRIPKIVAVVHADRKQDYDIAATRAVEHRVLRGKSPDYVQVVFDIKLPPTKFDISVPKFVYNSYRNKLIFQQKYLPRWAWPLWLAGALLGLLPLGVIPGLHSFTTTSHFSITGVLAILSFSIVLIVGFWRHGLGFFKLFVPHGTPLPMIPLIFPIEFISFWVRPFSLGLRLFVAMIAGHILMEVFGSFIVNGFNGGAMGWGVGFLSFLFIVFVVALELLMCAIQAYVFALLTTLYLSDAINLH